MPTLEHIFLKLENIKVIDSAIAYSQYIAVDLSVSNLELSKIDLKNAEAFEVFIENHLDQNQAKVAYGGYNEERNLYKRSGIFNASDNEERNIHIGMDLWIKAGTTVLAALDGAVHSFGLNAGLGNYGPTIILEHSIENQTFYTLYGHLSMESIEFIEIGAIFKKGQPLAKLGNPAINGDYAPHLHFQIIKDIKDNRADYPGVCGKNELKYYLENCPDPNLLLKIK